MPDVVARAAPAKLNLCLAVGPPRASDGYHPICSWFAPVSLCDSVRVERAASPESARFYVEWASDAPRPSPIDWPAEKDLAFRAHRLLEQLVARPLPASITITKRIPVGGGLGGGSSDAAAALLALRELFDLPIDAVALRTLALRLGSDVPFFIASDFGAPRPAVVQGVGESIEPAPKIAPGLCAVLLFPSFGCPTGAVYRAFDLAPPGRFRDAPVLDSARRASPTDAELFNDLAPAAGAVEPRLKDLRDRAAQAINRPVHVTGSGSTLFALIARNESARVIEPLRAAVPSCASCVVSFC